MIQTLSIALLHLLFAASTHTDPEFKPQPGLCNNLNALLKDEESEYAKFKGDSIIRTNEDGSRDYNLKLTFDGWDTAEFSKSSESVSIEVKKEFAKKEEAIALYNSTRKTITDCLGVTAPSQKADGVEALSIFTKSKSDFVVSFVKNEGKYYVVIFVTRS